MLPVTAWLQQVHGTQWGAEHHDLSNRFLCSGGWGGLSHLLEQLGNVPGCGSCANPCIGVLVRSLLRWCSTSVLRACPRWQAQRPPHAWRLQRSVLRQMRNPQDAFRICQLLSAQGKVLQMEQCMLDHCCSAILWLSEP